MTKSIRIAAVLGLLVGGIAVAQVAVSDDPFEVPVRRHGDYGEWAPDREFTFRFEDYRGRETVTGRYAVFRFSIGHTLPRLSGSSPNEGSSASLQLQHHASLKEDGTVEILPQATSAGEDWHFGSISPPFYETSMSPFAGSNGEGVRRAMRQAKQLSGPFPGYEPTSFSTAFDADDLYHVGEHCGYDLFESVAGRGWHGRPGQLYDFNRPRPTDVVPPFDRARVFGWPSPDGGTYDFGVICGDGQICTVAAGVRPWLRMRFQFRRAWLCDIPKVIPTHLDWLEGQIIEEETEILNPAYQ